MKAFGVFALRMLATIVAFAVFASLFWQWMLVVVRGGLLEAAPHIAVFNLIGGGLLLLVGGFVLSLIWRKYTNA